MKSKSSVIRKALFDFQNMEVITLTQKINVFFYRLKKLPIIKKMIPDTIYEKTVLKQILSAFVIVQNLLWDFLKKSGCLLIMDYFIVWLLHRGNGDIRLLDGVLTAMFFCHVIMGSIFNTVTFEVSEENYIMIKIFKANPKTFYIGNLLVKILMQSIFYLPGMLFIMYKVSENMLLYSILMLVIVAGSRIIGEAFNIKIYDKFGEKIMRIISNGMLFVLVAGYLLIWLMDGFPFVHKMLIYPVFYPAFGILCVSSVIYLFGYNRYHVIAGEYLVLDKVTYSEEIKDINNADIQLDEKMQTSLELSEKYENLNGYQYMNTIFFDRHKNLLKSKLKIKMILITIIFTALTLGICLTNKQPDVVGATIKSMPVMVFVMYVIASGNTVCRAFYFHCDNSLLKYGYYRKASTILLNFMIRFKYLIKIDVIPAVAICIGSMATILANGEQEQIWRVVPMYITIILLAVFFDMYQLFLYYVTQPYMNGTDLPSFTFRLCSNAMYILCYLSMQVETSSKWFTIGILIFVAIAIPSSFLAIYKIAPKNFRLKNQD